MFCCDTDIWVMEADGSNPRNITNTPGVIEWGPSWSPDGAKLAYNRSEDEYDWGANLWVMDADGANQTNHTNSVDTQQYPLTGRLTAPSSRSSATSKALPSARRRTSSS